MDSGEENEMLIPKNVIIASGSRPKSLPGLDIDGTSVLTSDEALELKQLPKSVLIIGGGVLGIEWASMLSDFGLGVTIMEYADRILPNEDRDISKEMQRILKKKKVKVVANAKVLPETIQKMNGSIAISAIVKGEEQTFAAEKILVSVGRRPNTENLGLQNTDIELDNGFIKVNKNYQTKESHIYAIGDVIGGSSLLMWLLMRE